MFPQVKILPISMLVLEEKGAEVLVQIRRWWSTFKNCRLFIHNQRFNSLSIHLILLSSFCNIFISTISSFHAQFIRLHRFARFNRANQSNFFSVLKMSWESTRAAKLNCDYSTRNQENEDHVHMLFSTMKIQLLPILLLSTLAPLSYYSPLNFQNYSPPKPRILANIETRPQWLLKPFCDKPHQLVNSLKTYLCGV